MSLVHERLYQTNNLARVDFQLYIRDLVANLLRVYGSPPGVKIKTAIDKVALDLDTAIPCGLIINELVSNTLKYAFPDDRSGAIFIGLQPGNADQVKLTVQDNGIGLPDGVDLQKADSLGLRLVYLLTNQLGGHCTIDNSQGASFQISFDIR
jgi:two-component sensor histidine kinase